MDEQVIRSLVEKLDCVDFERQCAVWSDLNKLGSGVSPYLLEFYPKARKRQGRAALLYFATQFARTDAAAFQLGLTACNDKSVVVRYRACGLLAFSLNPAALPHLEALLTHTHSQTVADAKAAIEAIRRRNHNLYIDRGGAGGVYWEIGGKIEGGPMTKVLSFLLRVSSKFLPEAK